MLFCLLYAVQPLCSFGDISELKVDMSLTQLTIRKTDESDTSLVRVCSTYWYRRYCRGRGRGRGRGRSREGWRDRERGSDSEIILHQAFLFLCFNLLRWCSTLYYNWYLENIFTASYLFTNNDTLIPCFWTIKYTHPTLLLLYPCTSSVTPVDSISVVSIYGIWEGRFLVIYSCL